MNILNASCILPVTYVFTNSENQRVYHRLFNADFFANLQDGVFL